MLPRLFLLGLFSLSFSAASVAQTRYVSDDLFIFIHSGPSNQFRILGSVDAGEKVDLLEVNQESNYAKIKLESGREGWVESKNLNRNPGLAQQLDKIKGQLSDSQNKLQQMQQQSESSSSELEQQLQQQQAQIESLTEDNARLQSQFQQITERNVTLEQDLSTQDEDVQMRWFIRGSLVAGAGLLFGLILPLLPRRKKRDSRWM